MRLFEHLSSVFAVENQEYSGSLFEIKKASKEVEVVKQEEPLKEEVKAAVNEKPQEVKEAKVTVSEQKSADYTPTVSVVNPNTINSIDNEKEKADIILLDQKMTAQRISDQCGFISQLDYIGIHGEYYVFAGMKNSNNNTIRMYLGAQVSPDGHCDIKEMDENDFQALDRVIDTNGMSQEDVDLMNWLETEFKGQLNKHKADLIARYSLIHSDPNMCTIVAPAKAQAHHCLSIYRDKAHIDHGYIMPQVNIALQGTDESKLAVMSEYFDQTTFQSLNPDMAKIAYSVAKMINNSEQLKIMLNSIKLINKFIVADCQIDHVVFMADLENQRKVQVSVIKNDQGIFANIVLWEHFDITACCNQRAA